MIHEIFLGFYNSNKRRESQNYWISTSILNLVLGHYKLIEIGGLYAEH